MFVWGRLTPQNEKIYGLKHVKPPFQPHKPRKNIETFQMCWEDSGSKDRSAYWAIGNADAYIGIIEKIQLACHMLLLPALTKISNDIFNRKSCTKMK